MSRKDTRHPVQAEKEEQRIVASSAAASISATPNACAALLDLAEELGRLLARRELARTDRRHGYSLLELVLGAAVLALVGTLIARSLVSLPH